MGSGEYLCSGAHVSLASPGYATIEQWHAPQSGLFYGKSSHSQMKRGWVTSPVIGVEELLNATLGFIA